MKTVLSTSITLDLFCKKPIQVIESSNNGIIAVLKNNTPIFYAVTPYCLKKLFDVEYTLQSEKIKKEKITKKFPMHRNWKPDKDFIHQSALWGIILTKETSESELACFISYWEAEGCFFHHIQWQQKLARSVQKSRSLNFSSQKKRDITHIPIPDKKTPDGFRGK